MRFYKFYKFYRNAPGVRMRRFDAAVMALRATHNPNSEMAATNALLFVILLSIVAAVCIMYFGARI